MVSSCFKLNLVHFLALKWPKCLVAGLPWENTWDGSDMWEGVLPPRLLLALPPGSTGHLSRPGGTSHQACSFPGLASPGGGPTLPPQHECYGQQLVLCPLLHREPLLPPAFPHGQLGNQGQLRSQGTQQVPE